MGKKSTVKIEMEDNQEEIVIPNLEESIFKSELDDDDDPVENGDESSLDDPENIDQWDPEDMKLLLEKIRENLPKTDTQKCWTTLEKLDWEKIKFKEHDSKDCKTCAQAIMKKIRKYRTLTEVLSDAFEWVENPWKSLTSKRVTHPDLPKKPLSSFMRYFSEKYSKIQASNPEISMSELAKVLAQKYKKLSEKKKEKYKASYEKDLVEYREKIRQFKLEHPEIYKDKQKVSKNKDTQIGPVKPHTPFEMYKLTKLKKITDPEEIKTFNEQSRDLWNNLTDKKRYKFIRKSLKDLERFKREVEEYQKEHPDEKYEPPKLKTLLNKSEFELKLKFEGMPERPPNSGYMLFSQIMLKELKDVPAKEKMVLIAKRWKEMTEQERASYNEDAQTMTNEYIVKFDEFLQGLPEDEKERIMLDQKFKFPAEKRLAIKNNIDNTAFIAYQMEELPRMQKKYPKKSKQEIMEKINNEWKAMDAQNKSKYMSLAESIQEFIPHKEPLQKLKRKCAYGEEESEFGRRTGIKRPKPNGYVQFCHRILSKQTDMDTQQRMKYASQQWKQVPEEQRQQFAAIAKERYRRYMEMLKKFKMNGELPDEEEIQQFKKEIEGGDDIFLEQNGEPIVKRKKTKKNKETTNFEKITELPSLMEQEVAMTTQSNKSNRIDLNSDEVNCNKVKKLQATNSTGTSWSNILYKDSESSVTDSD